MTPDDLRQIIAYLRARVQLDEDGGPNIVFEPPTSDQMLAAGLDAEGCERLLGMSWWDEMVQDVLETPAFCEPDAAPQDVLGYARDVIDEYIRKLFPLE